jgi:predicted enzyme related to lactoylglutathione lyase
MSALPLVYVEISAKDPATSAKFYSELFGWNIMVEPQMDYHQFKAEGGPGGGFPKVDGKTMKAGDVVNYIAADDIDAMLKKIVAHGGKVLQPKTAIPGYGAYAFFADPSGNRLGLFKQDMPAS